MCGRLDRPWIVKTNPALTYKACLQHRHVRIALILTRGAVVSHVLGVLLQEPLIPRSERLDLDLVAHTT